MRLSESVTVQDVGEAVRLMKVAMQQSSIDPRTGQIDMASGGRGWKGGVVAATGSNGVAVGRQCCWLANLLTLPAGHGSCCECRT